MSHLVFIEYLGPDTVTLTTTFVTDGFLFRVVLVIRVSICLSYMV